MLNTVILHLLFYSYIIHKNSFLSSLIFPCLAPQLSTKQFLPFNKFNVLQTISALSFLHSFHSVTIQKQTTYHRLVLLERTLKVISHRLLKAGSTLQEETAASLTDDQSATAQIFPVKEKPTTSPPAGEK